MFAASEPIPTFDYLRVPYRLDPGIDVPDGFAALEADACTGARAAGRLVWPSARQGTLLATVSHRLGEVEGVRVVARAIDSATMAASLGSGWAPTRAGDGDWHVWRSQDGGIGLSFDPAEAMETLWTEGYRGALDGRGLAGREALVRAYYLVRPLIARPVQIALRRAFARLQRPPLFPAWPIETAGPDLLALIHTLASEAAGCPVPWIAPWPKGYEWVLTLTHDVETAFGAERIAVMREIEASLGFTSSWNFVPRRYHVDRKLLADLVVAGCEVGVHGLYHDGRDLASVEALRARLPEMESYAREWDAVGFRSPATQRGSDVIALLPFEYDSSYPDTDPYEPQPGGSCTWYPYEIGDVVELPITLPQDHTLFTILGHKDPSTWLEKTEAIRRRGGMALALTHPDYLSDADSAAPYRALLEAYAEDATAWRALPRDVARWWRRRGQSQVTRDGSDWFVTGPAADEARVSFDAP